MELIVKQFSSLEKICEYSQLNKPHIASAQVFRGEHYAYQYTVYSDRKLKLKCEVVSPIKDYIKIYSVQKTIMDAPQKPLEDDDYLADKSGLMPDLLLPLSEQNYIFSVCSDELATLWVDIAIPEDCDPGKYPIEIRIWNLDFKDWEKIEASEMFYLTVLNLKLPKQKTMFTQWFHTDCIATVHNVEIFSEQHWEWIDKYMQAAVELGINMILTPVISPPLDTAIGVTRPNVQLVDIEKHEDVYHFDFSKLRRWIGLCKRNGIQYYEISQLFSQWGLKYTPTITVMENGCRYNLFGWHKEARDPQYKAFLEQLLPKLIEVLTEERIVNNCYFHISDEPTIDYLDNYMYAYHIIKPLIGECKIIDALSGYEFYERGLVDVPVVPNNKLKPFLEKDIDPLFAYYCLGQNKKVSNRFIAMPSYRNRIMGLQMYKYNIKGFLHWGFNFYYSGSSYYPIAPLLTTSCDKSFPSGDPFTVYPGKNSPLHSLRGKVFKDALQDMEICRLLETYIGRDKVIELIDQEAGMDVTFEEYPRNVEYIPRVVDKMKQILKEKSSGL